MVYRVFIVLIALFAASVASAQTDFRIGPGDTVRIEVLEDPSLNREVLVLPDGSLSFPLAGAVQAGGQTTTQLEIGCRLGACAELRDQPDGLGLRRRRCAPRGHRRGPHDRRLHHGAGRQRRRSRAGGSRDHRPAGPRAVRRLHPLRRDQAHPAPPHRSERPVRKASTTSTTARSNRARRASGARFSPMAT